MKSEEKGLIKDYFAFTIDNNTYALDMLSFVKEIVVPTQFELHETPGLKSVMCQAVVREELLPVIDLRVKYKINSINEATCLLIMKTKKGSLGALIESVEDVVSIELDKVVSSDKNRGNPEITDYYVKDRDSLYIIINPNLLEEINE